MLLILFINGESEIINKEQLPLYMKLNGKKIYAIRNIKK